MTLARQALCCIPLICLMVAVAHGAALGSPAELAGEWTTVKEDATGQYTALMVLEEDGSADLEGTIVYGEAYLDSLDTTNIEGFSLFAEGFTVTFAATGAWWADDDSLHIDVGDAALLLNGMEPRDFVVDAGRRLANVLADALGLPEDGREAFEANTIAALLLQMDPDELTGEAMSSFELGKAYVLDEDELTLTLTDAEGTSRWQREGVVICAVAATTWGRVKRGLGSGVLGLGPAPPATPKKGKLGDG